MQNLCLHEENIKNVNYTLSLFSYYNQSYKKLNIVTTIKLNCIFMLYAKTLMWGDVPASHACEYFDFCMFGVVPPLVIVERSHHMTLEVLMGLKTK